MTLLKVSNDSLYNTMGWLNYIDLVKFSYTHTKIYNLLNEISLYNDRVKNEKIKSALQVYNFPLIKQEYSIIPKIIYNVSDSGNIETKKNKERKFIMVESLGPNIQKKEYRIKEGNKKFLKDVLLYKNNILKSVSIHQSFRPLKMMNFNIIGLKKKIIEININFRTLINGKITGLNITYVKNNNGWNLEKAIDYKNNVITGNYIIFKKSNYLDYEATKYIDEIVQQLCTKGFISDETYLKMDNTIFKFSIKDCIESFNNGSFTPKDVSIYYNKNECFNTRYTNEDEYLKTVKKNSYINNDDNNVYLVEKFKFRNDCKKWDPIQRYSESNGKKFGSYTEYKDGFVSRKTQCVNGEFHGKCEEFEVCNLKKVYYYNMGCIEGNFTTFNIDKSVKKVERFKNGVYHGITEDFENGIIVKKSMYTNGNLMSTVTHNGDGSVTTKKFWNGILHGLITINMNGINIYEGIYVNGNLHGEVIHRCGANGHIIFRESYMNGMPVNF